jgi:hypothetical protein
MNCIGGINLLGPQLVEELQELYKVSNFLESITYFFSLVKHIIRLFPGG